MDKVFDRRKNNWVYHSVYVDATKTKTKRVLDWNGKRYDVLLENGNPYFIDEKGQKWVIKL